MLLCCEVIFVANLRTFGVKNDKHEVCKWLIKYLSQTLPTKYLSQELPNKYLFHSFPSKFSPHTHCSMKKISQMLQIFQLQNRFAFVWSLFHGCLCWKLNENETTIQLISIIETTFYLLNRNDKANLIFWKALQSNWVSLLTNPTGLYLKLSFDQFKNVKNLNLQKTKKCICKLQIWMRLESLKVNAMSEQPTFQSLHK